MYETGQFHHVVTVYQKFQKNIDREFKDNVELKLIIAQSFLYSGNDEKAEQRFSQLSETYPDNDQVAYYTAVSYIKKQQFSQALKFLYP